MKEIMYDIKDIAKLLKISLRTAHRLRSAKNLPAGIRIGALVRWREADIDQWIADGCPEQGKEPWGPSTSKE